LQAARDEIWVSHRRVCAKLADRFKVRPDLFMA
jgi:hypothetical protein